MWPWLLLLCPCPSWIPPKHSSWWLLGLPGCEGRHSAWGQSHQEPRVPTAFQTVLIDELLACNKPCGATHAVSPPARLCTVASKINCSEGGVGCRRCWLRRRKHSWQPSDRKRSSHLVSGRLSWTIGATWHLAFLSPCSMVSIVQRHMVQHAFGGGTGSLQGSVFIQVTVLGWLCLPLAQAGDRPSMQCEERYLCTKSSTVPTSQDPATKALVGALEGQCL